MLDNRPEMLYLIAVKEQPVPSAEERRWAGIACIVLSMHSDPVYAVCINRVSAAPAIPLRYWIIIRIDLDIEARFYAEGDCLPMQVYAVCVTHVIRTTLPMETGAEVVGEKG